MTPEVLFVFVTSASVNKFNYGSRRHHYHAGDLACTENAVRSTLLGMTTREPSPSKVRLPVWRNVSISDGLLNKAYYNEWFRKFSIVSVSEPCVARSEAKCFMHTLSPSKNTMMRMDSRGTNTLPCLPDDPSLDNVTHTHMLQLVCR